MFVFHSNLIFIIFFIVIIMFKSAFHHLIIPFLSNSRLLVVVFGIFINSLCFLSLHRHPKIGWAKALHPNACLRLRRKCGLGLLPGHLIGALLASRWGEVVWVGQLKWSQIWIKDFDWLRLILGNQFQLLIFKFSMRHIYRILISSILPFEFFNMIRKELYLSWILYHILIELLEFEFWWNLSLFLDFIEFIYYLFTRNLNRRQRDQIRIRDSIHLVHFEVAIDLRGRILRNIDILLRLCDVAFSYTYNVAWIVIIIFSQLKLWANVIVSSLYYLICFSRKVISITSSFLLFSFLLTAALWIFWINKSWVIALFAHLATHFVLWCTLTANEILVLRFSVNFPKLIGAWAAELVD